MCLLESMKRSLFHSRGKPIDGYMLDVTEKKKPLKAEIENILT